MLLHLTLLIPLILSASTSASPSSSNITLNFDTIPIPPSSSGLAPLPTPHHHLTFSPAFRAFTPLSPALSHLLSPRDRNCAVSPPNALLGSPLSASEPASFAISGGGGGKWFTLRGFWVKPLDFPPAVEGGGVRVRVRGFKAAGLIAAAFEAADGIGGDGEGTVVEWEVEFPYGYHDVFEVRMGVVSQADWTRLRKVEMEARFGEGLEWEFCVDGLGVEVFGGEEGEEVFGEGEGEGVEGVEGEGGVEVFGEEGFKGEGVKQRILAGK